MRGKAISSIRRFPLRNGGVRCWSYSCNKFHYNKAQAGNLIALRAWVCTITVTGVFGVEADSCHKLHIMFVININTGTITWSCCHTIFFSLPHLQYCTYLQLYLKSLNAKTDISIIINLRHLRLKLLNNKENNKKICHIFHHNFKNIPCFVISEVIIEKVLFCFIWWWTYFKNFEMGVYRFLHSNSSFVTLKDIV